MKTSEDPARQLIELAITSGRSHQSPQTRLIQSCHESIDEGVNHTIPLYDNLLFALALLRTRSSANIEEAKRLFTQLLHYQSPLSESKGNFPVYLHQYPFCPDRLQGAHLLPCLYWSLHGFSKILGEGLSKELEAAAELALEHLWREQEKKNASFQTAIKLAGASVAFGRLLNSRELEKRGFALFDRLLEESREEAFGTWYAPVYLAETLIGLQMAYKKLSESPWNGFWSWLQKSWHPLARSYCGPAVQLFQWDTEPESTLYDLYCGFFSGGILPYHAFYDSPYQLQGALVQPTEDRWEGSCLKEASEGTIAGNRWNMLMTESFGASSIETKGPLPAQLKKGFYPFRFVWGDRNQVHTLALQAGNPSAISCSFEAAGCTIDVALAEPVETKDKDKNIEVALFCNREEENVWTVRGKKATTFRLDDELLLSNRLLKLRATFQLIEGRGSFFGHLMPGNRPAQKKRKGRHRFDAYDMQLFLRTVRREEPCLIRIRLEFFPQGPHRLPE